MRLIQINANNIVFTLKIKNFLCKIVINYLLSPFFMVFFHLYNIVFYFYVFLYLIMCVLNVARAVKKKSVNEIRDFIFENYYKKFGFLKKTVVIL